MSKKTTAVADKPRSKTELKKAIPPEGIRCKFTDLAGRRCRGLSLRPRGSGASRTKSGYCLVHATEVRQQQEAVEVAGELLDYVPFRENPLSVNRVLDKLFEMTAFDRISIRKATLLTYQASLLLNSANQVRTQILDGFGSQTLSNTASHGIRKIYEMDKAKAQAESDIESESDSESDSDSESGSQPESKSEPVSASEPNPDAKEVTQ